MSKKTYEPVFTLGDDAQPAAETSSVPQDRPKNELVDLRELNVLAAAQVLMNWTDKQRALATNQVYREHKIPYNIPVPERKLSEAPPAHQKLYELLAIAVVRALAEPKS